MVNAAINGFGRIGRSSFRVWLSRPELHKKIKIVAINTSGSMDTAGWAHLLKYDSNYGPLKQTIKVESLQGPKEATDDNPLIGYLTIGEAKVPILAQRDPEKIPWGKYDVDVVIESTGVFRDKEGANKHITGGAKKVLISAPSKGDGIQTAVIGVNDAGDSALVDNASCTTNCTSPVAQVIHTKLGITKAALTTIHGYTDDQKLQDGSHADLRRARAAAQNIIPTSTGAAIATTKVVPELEGLFDGVAIRVPVSVGSISDITCVVSKPTTVEEINQILTEASKSDRYKGILAVTKEPLVSSDIKGRSESSIVDLSMTQVIAGDLVKIMAWYDNEWGYCNRLVEQALAVGS